VRRIKIDIKDLDLTKVDLIDKRNIIVVGKHLCGGGTDVSLRCALHLNAANSSQKKEEGEERHTAVEGFTIALCCHQRCTWESYVNKPFLEELGLNRAEFDILTKLTTWATCGRRRSPQQESCAEGRESDDDEDHGGEEEEEEEEIEEGKGNVGGEDGENPKVKRRRLEKTEGDEEERDEEGRLVFHISAHKQCCQALISFLASLQGQAALLRTGV